MKASWKCHESVMKASWKCHESLKTLEMLEDAWDAWRCLKTLEDAWRCLKMLEDAWRHLKMLEDAWRRLKMLEKIEDNWRCLMMHDDISIMHLIKRHHPCNQHASPMESTSIMHLIKRHHPCNQHASSMESTSIIHGINKHHVINKHQECYSIIDNSASLIATFKHYALVLFEGFPKHNHLLVRCSVCTNQILASADDTRLSQDCDWSGLFIYFGIDQWQS